MVVFSPRAASTHALCSYPRRDCFFSPPGSWSRLKVQADRQQGTQPHHHKRDARHHPRITLTISPFTSCMHHAQVITPRLMHTRDHEHKEIPGMNDARRTQPAITPTTHAKARLNAWLSQTRKATIPSDATGIIPTNSLAAIFASSPRHLVRRRRRRWLVSARCKITLFVSIHSLSDPIIHHEPGALYFTCFAVLY